MRVNARFWWGAALTLREITRRLEFQKTVLFDPQIEYRRCFLMGSWDIGASIAKDKEDFVSKI